MARDLLLEIGTEEIPAAFFPEALENLRGLTLKGLDEARLAHGEARILGTPRRLAVLVASVAEAQPDAVREELGPPLRHAFEEDGTTPKKAALNFAAKIGVPIERLRRVTLPKGEYLAATVEEKGRPASEVLPGILAAAVSGLPWKKSMRWGDVPVAFARPVHWILARSGGEIVSFGFGDVQSGGTTLGHRFLSPGPHEIPEAAGYVEGLRRAEVLVDPVERRAAVKAAAQRGAVEAGGVLLPDEGLLDHVTFLVERPTPIVGSFDPSFLDLPKEVLVSEMKGHQKYFSVTDPSGKILPAFVAIANTPVKDPSLARRGFERVLAARLTDGRFFFDEDRKQPLPAFVERLKKVTFQQKLGTSHEKVERFGALALWLGRQLGLPQESLAHVGRAAQLAKADLVTGMVGEFPELQGVMGREYALAAGEPPAVALGIYEHYLPRGLGGELPTSDVGAVIGIADRIDTIAGIFGIGKPPTGAADPFGLRRAALGIIHVTLARGYRYSLPALIDQALLQLEGKLSSPAAEVRGPVLEFFRARLKALWSDEHPVEIVEAVLGAGFEGLISAKARLDAVDAMLGNAEFRALAEGFSRTNIVEKAKSAPAKEIDPELFEKDAERALFKAFLSARKAGDSKLAADDFAAVLRDFVGLRAPLDAFFTEVMVMAEDPRVRDNRLRLLFEIRELFGKVADFGKMDLRKLGASRRET